MESHSQSQQTSRWYCAVLLAGFLATALLYFPARAAWFTLEDILWLEKLTPQKLLSFFFSSWGFCNLYRPLMRISFWVDLNLFGANPLGWHLHSWLLHAANGAWLFLILRRLAGSTGWAAGAWLLVITAPVGVENLTWISGRTHLLCAFFYLAAFYAVVQYSMDFPRRPARLGLAAGLFLAAILTYEAAFSFPVVVALWLWAPGQQHPLSRRQRFYLPALFALELGLALIARYFILNRSLGQVDLAHAGYLRGLLMNIRSIGDVVGLNFPEQFVFALPIAGAALLLARRKRWNGLGQGAALVLAAAALYLPFSGTVGLPLRFLYLAQIPYWILLAGAWLVLVAAWPRWKAALLLVLALQTGFQAVRCFTYAGRYRAAAAVAKAIPDQFQTMYPAPPPGINYVFCNIPRQHNGIAIFNVGFSEAIRRCYVHFDGRIFLAEELPAAPGSSQPGENVPAKYFHYRETDRRLVEIAPAEWEMLNRD
jgi:hypothetical protein